MASNTRKRLKRLSSVAMFHGLGSYAPRMRRMMAPAAAPVQPSFVRESRLTVYWGPEASQKYNPISKRRAFTTCQSTGQHTHR
jgi:hypothetical protein